MLTQISRAEVEEIRDRLDQFWEDIPVTTEGGRRITYVGTLENILDGYLKTGVFAGEPERLW